LRVLLGAYFVKKCLFLLSVGHFVVLVAVVWDLFWYDMRAEVLAGETGLFVVVKIDEGWLGGWKFHLGRSRWELGLSKINVG